MNIAVLFDGTGPAGMDSTDAAFRAFYAHRDIDRIFLIGGCQIPAPENDILDKESKGKPVTILHDIDTLADLWLYILQGEYEKPDFYVFHDIRNTDVTDDKIRSVLDQAKENGIALCTDGSDGLTYPAAVDAKHYILHHLRQVRGILRELTEIF